MVSLMTALWFAELRAGTRSRSSPTPRRCCTRSTTCSAGSTPPTSSLRAFGGLQPTRRTKDPDPVDYSTGSVGIGATATIWGAVARRYLRARRGAARRPPDRAARRRRARRGRGLGGVADPWCRASARCCGSSTSTASRSTASSPTSRPGAWPNVHGRRLAGGHGEVRPCACARSARRCAPASTRWERGVPAAAARRGGRGARAAAGGRADRARVAELGDAGCSPRCATSAATTSASCSRPTARTRPDRPSVIFAYTIKGWRLPTEGHPSNHSALLTEAQFGELAGALGTDPDDPWAGFAEGSAEAELCAAAAARLARAPVPLREPPAVPARRRRGTPARGRPSRRWGACCSTSCTRRPRSRRAS